jgi:anti-anti-sigma regulatory factor
MRLSARGNVIMEAVGVGVRVLRFVRPDVRPHLDDAGPAATSPLFREIHDVALADLAQGSTLVVNLGLVEGLGAAFYRFLLGVRQGVAARGGRLVLCGLTPRQQEVFDLFRAPCVFTVAGSEAEAYRRWPRAAGGGIPDLRERGLLRAVSG